MISQRENPLESQLENQKHLHQLAKKKANPQAVRSPQAIEKRQAMLRKNQVTDQRNPVTVRSLHRHKMAQSLRLLVQHFEANVTLKKMVQQLNLNQQMGERKIVNHLKDQQFHQKTARNRPAHLRTHLRPLQKFPRKKRLKKRNSFISEMFVKLRTRVFLSWLRFFSILHFFHPMLLNAVS